jgi:hypothetical protein
LHISTRKARLNENDNDDDEEDDDEEEEKVEGVPTWLKPATNYRLKETPAPVVPKTSSNKRGRR